jgi:hypothetical protein
LTSAGEYPDLASCTGTKPTWLKEGKQMTAIQLYRYLHNRILDALAKHDEAELRYLSITVETLYEAAECSNDTDAYQLLDDMTYLLNETLTGAQVKGESCLPLIELKLKQMEGAEGQNSSK